MNKVQKKIHDEIVKPALSRLPGDIIGRVISFNNETQTGVVEFSTGANSPAELVRDVPYMAIGGVKQAAPLPDDNVLIGFIGSTHRYPYMYGKMDMRHVVRTRIDEHSHKGTGAQITELYTEREGESWL